MQERKGEEMRLMNSHQNASREDNRYYAIEASWVQHWLNFVEGKDYFTNKKVNVPPPGPIQNEALEQVLTNLKEGESIEAERFFLVNKNLFYFFHMIYGGGPAIVNNKIFAQFETHEDLANRLQIPANNYAQESDAES